MSVSCVHVCACVSENSKHIYADFAVLAGYSYERLDGSVRGEERNLAIKNFSTKDVFVFLLSTKAGGCPVFSPNALHFSAPICYRAVMAVAVLGGRGVVWAPPWGRKPISCSLYERHPVLA